MAESDTTTGTAGADESATNTNAHSRRRGAWRYGLTIALTAAITFAVAALLVSIFTRKAEQRTPFVRLVEVNETTTDPEVWRKNWPREYDGYSRTVDTTRTRYGGSEAMPAQKLDRDPWLKRMYSGYAFSIDYRDRRGHAYMLADQEQTERVLKKPQPGACLHCHASIAPTWRRVGAEALGQQVSLTDFQWPAVMKGFELMSTMSYAQAHAEVLKTPDGSSNGEAGNSGPAGGSPAATSGTTAPTTRQTLAHQAGKAHPVSCVDCHDPDNMELRVTRPGFVRGIQALANSKEPTPHLPSIERWRQGNRSKAYDPNVDATRQEMRSFACGQCHVEYYCGPKETLFFPWDNGLRVEQIEKTFDEHKFPDGKPFNDWVHGETGAPVSPWTQSLNGLPSGNLCSSKVFSICSARRPLSHGKKSVSFGPQ